MTEVEQTLDSHKEIAVSHEEIKQQLAEQKVRLAIAVNEHGLVTCVVCVSSLTGRLSGIQEFQKLLRSKRPMYEATLKSGRSLRQRAQTGRDRQHLENLLAELKDTWDTIGGKSVERYGL